MGRMSVRKWRLTVLGFVPLAEKDVDVAVTTGLHTGFCRCRAGKAGPITEVRASGNEHNSSMHFQKTMNQKPHNLIGGLAENSARLSSQEEHGRLSNLEPTVSRNCISSSTLGSKSAPEINPWSSDICIAFSRDMNDIIWATYKDFELPLAFEVHEANSENACKRTEIESDEEDEDYKFFLENVRQCGTSQVLELKGTHGSCVNVVRFEEAEDEPKPQNCCDRNLKLHFPRDRQEHTSRCGDSKTCRNPKNYLNCRHALPTEKKKLGASVVSENEEARKTMRSMDFDERSVVRVNSKAKGTTIRQNMPKKNQTTKSALQYHSRQFVKAEEPFLTKTSPYHMTTDDHVGSRGIPLCIQSAGFRKNLEATLKEPFSTQQLFELWNAVNCRKPIIQLRQTRRRTVQVETNQEGSSYLDYHPDLAERLASTTNPQEKLALLRGFFFWLKHSSWADAFQPWVSSCTQKANSNVNNDDDCVEVDRPDCEVIAVVLPVDEKETVTSIPQKEPEEKHKIQEHDDKVHTPWAIKVKEELSTDSDVFTMFQ